MQEGFVTRRKEATKLIDFQIRETDKSIANSLEEFIRVVKDYKSRWNNYSSIPLQMHIFNIAYKCAGNEMDAMIEHFTNTPVCTCHWATNRLYW